MGTRGTVAVQAADGMFETIYVGHDTYPDHVGNLLLTVYDTAEKALQITALGDLSAMDNTVEKSRRESYHVGGSEEWDDIKPRRLPDMKAIKDDAEQRGGTEYIYVMQNGAWTCNGKPLTREMIDDDE
jgi:hypothetical protein